MKPIEVCPTCGETNSVFLLFGVSIELDGSPSGGRTPGVCNSFRCDQRYWYFPTGRRVTRRNVGPTYEEWRKHRDEPLTNLSAINVRRHYAGLTELMEKPTRQLVSVNSIDDPANWNPYTWAGSPMARWGDKLVALWRKHWPFRKGVDQ